jgi:hypothetical protein
MKKLLLITIVSIAVISCKNKEKTAGSNSGDAAFQKISDAFLQGYLSWRPQTSVSLGFHEYDGKITDYSKASLDSELKRHKTYDEKLAAFDTSSLSTRMYYDFRILRSGIKNEIYNFEDIKAYTNNPMTYVGAVDVNLYIKRNYAPLEDRLRHVI